MAQHNDFGKWGEQTAEEYLHDNGYIILERDWRHDHKDIDIIAYLSHSDTLVSVEVKTRRNEDFLMAINAVTARKERNLVRATFAFAKQSGHFFRNIRFDVITIVGSKENYELKHYEDFIQPGNRKGYRLI